MSPTGPPKLSDTLSADGRREWTAGWTAGGCSLLLVEPIEVPASLHSPSHIALPSHIAPPSLFGQDEVLVCTQPDGKRDKLKDDTLSELLTTLPEGVRVLTVVDACHSGSPTDLGA